MTLAADPGGRAVCGRSLAGIVCSNTVGGMDACLLRLSCVVRSRRRADHSPRRVLHRVVCLGVTSKRQQQ